MANHDLSFLEFLNSFRRGELIARLDDLLGELMEAIQKTGGKGEINLKMPFKQNAAGQIECVPVPTIKKPSLAIGTGIYFVTDEGRLTRRDPAQNDLFEEDEGRPLRGVPPSLKN